MDKDKVIDELLMEWAMRSPDGLAGGHDTPENIAVLNEILEERDKERKKKRGDIWDHFGSLEGKAVRPDDLRYVKNIVERDPQGKRFSRMYNKLNLRRASGGFPSAISVYEDATFADIINKIDRRERKGLGRGELVFLFLLKGVRSGGTSDSDLLYAEDEGVVEMKELTGKSKKRIIKVSAATLQGFARSDIKGAIDELVVELRRQKKLGPFLERVLSGKKNGVDLYPADMVVTNNHRKYLKQFVDDLRTGDMPAALFNGLAVIGKKLRNAVNSNEKRPPELATVSVALDDKAHEFKIDNASAAKSAVDRIVTDPDKNKALNLQVSLGATKSDKELEHIARGLKYFKHRYSIPVISKELSGLIADNYNGILVIDKRGGNHAYYYPAGTKFTFVGITMGGSGIKLSLDHTETEKSAEKSDETPE